MRRRCRASASRTASQKRLDRVRRLSRRATIRRRRRRQRPRASASEYRQRRLQHATHQTKTSRRALSCEKPGGTSDQSKTFPAPPKLGDMRVEDRRPLGPGDIDSRSLANRVRASCARRFRYGLTGRQRTRSGVSSPWNWSSSSRNRRAAPASTSPARAALTKRPTGVTKGGSSRTSRAAVATRDVARTRRMKDEADRICPGLDRRRAHRADGRQAADLDPRAPAHGEPPLPATVRVVSGSQSIAAVRSGTSWASIVVRA